MTCNNRIDSLLDEFEVLWLSRARISAAAFYERHKNKKDFTALSNDQVSFFWQELNSLERELVELWAFIEQIGNGKYQALGKIGSGGMAQVYHAYDTGFKEEVAIKTLSHTELSDKEMVARFRREQVIHGKLRENQHPNIVRAFTHEKLEDGTTMLVTEYIAGKTIDELTVDGATKSLKDALGIVFEIAKGLQHAETLGIVHRDIHSGNIIIDDTNCIPKILDLGLGVLLSSDSVDVELPRFSQLEMGFSPGRRGFKSPEQIKGAKDIDIRADIYGLGCVFFHILTGKDPIVQENSGGRLSFLKNDVEFEGKDIAEAFIVNMCALDPEHRYETPQKLIDDIETFRRTSQLPRPISRSTTPGITQSVMHNSQKQLAAWKRKNGKLYGLLCEDDEYLPMKLIEGVNEYTIDVFLTKLKSNICHHAIIIGEGGMGKTTTCMRLWESYLKKGNQVFYIPLCNYSSTNTIESSIIKECGFVSRDQYEQLMQDNDILLLLDGFNEMKNECKRDFFTELYELSTKEQIQILITSRNNVIDSSVSSFAKLTFKPLSKETIDECLERHLPDSKKIPLSPELYDVLSNPMLLKIYAVNINTPILTSNTQKSGFLTNPTTAGEIIWNFLEHQIIKSNNLYEDTERFSRILFRYLLPYIAYNIELRDNIHFTLVELKKLIDGFEIYFKANCVEIEDLIYYGDIIDEFLSIKNRTKFLLEMCVENFSIINLSLVDGADSNTYTFVHQHFRDIFSATHIKNQMILNDKEVFTERILPFHISRMLLEILQEHKYEPKS